MLLQTPLRFRPSACRTPRIVAFIASGMLFSLTALAPARDTTSPARFDLLVPDHNAITYTTTYGNKPRLAWRECSDSESGIDRYEIWLDGSKVDDIPAGAHGHLPGGKVHDYEPFRPYGSLAGDKVCYYTPPLSKLSAGARPWHVVAVDKAGNKRRSASTFQFTVQAFDSDADKGRVFDSARVFVNHLGYLPTEDKRIVVDGGVGATEFEVVDLAGKSVFSGKLHSGGGVFGNYLVGDITGLAASGTYRVKAGPDYSMWFPVGLEAKLNYEDYLRKYRHAYRRKRCGNTTANLHGRPCHLDDARMRGGTRFDLIGGWHASSDLRKIMRILQPGLYGLIEMRRIVNPAWDSGDDSILDEIKWGNSYIHKMQLENGALGHHYYLWCGLTDFGESANVYTNNIVGDADDRLLPDDTVVIDMVDQSRFIRNQTTIYRIYKDSDPEYARKCLDAAVKCYDYFVNTWPVVTDYETTFNARPYEETVTDFMPLAYGVRVNLYMFLATNKAEYRDRAIALADELMALQETKYVAGQTEVKGFFYRDAKRQSIFCSLMAHGGMDGAEGGVIVLADLCEAMPNHAKAPQWQESLRSYLEDYLLALSRKNAFGIVPAYLSLSDSTLGQKGMTKRVGGLHYQYLCQNRGANKHLARKAILLARGARILDNPELRGAAWRQIGWILGNNPVNRSWVFGAGHGQPVVYKAALEPRSDGMVVQGIGFNLYFRQGHWRWCEMELHNTAWFGRALFELLSANRK